MPEMNRSISKQDQQANRLNRNVNIALKIERLEDGETKILLQKKLEAFLKSSIDTEEVAGSDDISLIKFKILEFIEKQGSASAGQIRSNVWTLRKFSLASVKEVLGAMVKAGLAREDASGRSSKYTAIARFKPDPCDLVLDR